MGGTQGKRQEPGKGREEQQRPQRPHRPGVHDKGDVDDTRPGGDVREVGDPGAVGRLGDSRSRRLGARAAPGSRIVVITFLPRTMPAMPVSYMSRSTVQRATAWPCRFSPRRIFLAP
ncbi:hypothetical protein GCM10010425_64520 [Streptomyces spororaveus]|uniref:Uncharacterized protein n=1 Tax=Streptomyces spororaveus TaxID=284039 RepID=A0ABQ3T6U8_9ACTN|nr:hypothetical protein Sspor_16620 [Streptomyces spororaveus]